MIYRAPTEEDFASMQALDLELAMLEDPAFDGLPDRERASRLRTSLAALRFHARTEHSFVAADGLDALAPVLGFVLAQSVWMGDRPLVWVSSLRVHPDAPAGAGAGLLHACVKSAYDTAVYEVHMAVSEADWPLAEREGFRDGGRHAVRYLGSRNETAPGAGG
jgi:hypothetical protein